MYILKQGVVYCDPALNQFLIVNLRRDVCDISLQLETSEIGDVVKWNLLNIELEAALVRDITEWALAISLDISNLYLTTVALRLILLTLVERHCVRVLITVVLSKFEGVETDPLAELRELHHLNVCH